MGQPARLTNEQKRELLRNTNGDPHLKGKSPSYIIGWNKVKYRHELRNAK